MIESPVFEQIVKPAHVPPILLVAIPRLAVDRSWNKDLRITAQVGEATLGQRIVLINVALADAHVWGGIEGVPLAKEARRSEACPTEMAWESFAERAPRAAERRGCNSYTNPAQPAFT